MRKVISAISEAKSSKDVDPLTLDSFVYKGKTVYPLKSFDKSDRDYLFKYGNWASMTGKYPIMDTKSGWNYEEFYKEAKKVGAGKVDIFYMDGKAVLPTSGYLHVFNYRDINILVDQLTRKEKNKAVEKDLMSRMDGEDVWNDSEFKTKR
jgi:hypothetical protein